MPQRKENKRSAVCLLLLALLLTACAVPSKISAVVCPQLPSMPSVTQPQPSQPYSTSVRTDIEGWLKRLTDMPAMSGP